MALQSQVFNSNHSLPNTAFLQKRLSLIFISITISVLLFSSSHVFAQNVKFDFDEGREATQIGNVRQMESSRTFNARQIEEIKQSMISLQKEVEELKTSIGTGKESTKAETSEEKSRGRNLDDIARRIDELYRSYDELIESQNELIGKIEHLSNDDIRKRLVVLEKEMKRLHPAQGAEESKEAAVS